MNLTFADYAVYYDLLYRDKPYAAEAAYVLSLLEDRAIRSGSILELGCGTGRHAAHFADAGFNVDGHDISAQMIEMARRAQGDRPSLQFSVSDIRTLRSGALHDAVVSLFHVASYQTRNADLLAMFATAAAHMSTDAILVFDFWYGPGVMADPPEIRKKRLRNDVIEIERIATPAMDVRRNVVDVAYDVSVTSVADRSRTRFHETHRMRYLFEPELDLMLERSGLVREATYAFPTRDEPTRDTWQAIAIARHKPT